MTYTSVNNGVTTVKSFSPRDSFVIDNFINNFRPASTMQYGKACEQKVAPLIATPVIKGDPFKDMHKIAKMLR